MKYRLISWAWGDIEENQELLNNLLSIDGVTSKINEDGKVRLYYEWNSPEDLKRLLDSISRDCYDDFGWKPEEVVINPYDKEIVLRDTYLE